MVAFRFVFFLLPLKDPTEQLHLAPPRDDGGGSKSRPNQNIKEEKFLLLSKIKVYPFQRQVFVFVIFTGFYRVSRGFTRPYFVSLDLEWALLGLTGFYRVLLGFTGFYWVLLGFTGFYWVLLGVTEFREISKDARAVRKKR